MAAPSFVLKLERADDHLKTLIEEVRWWVQSDAYRVSEEIDPETDRTTVYVEPISEPPLKLSILMGDALHCVGRLTTLPSRLRRATLATSLPLRLKKSRSFRSTAMPTAGIAAMSVGSDRFMMTRGQSSSGCSRIRLGMSGSPIHSGSFGNSPTSISTAASRLSAPTPCWALPRLQGRNAYIGYLQLHAAAGPLERKTPLVTWGGLRDPTTGAAMKMDYSVAMHIEFSEADPKPDAPIAGKEVLEVLFAIRDLIAFQVIPNLQPFREGVNGSRGTTAA